MLRKPLFDVGVVVGGVVVDHDVQLLIRICLGDHLEELQELDATVAWVARIGDFAGRNLEGGEQGGSLHIYYHPGRPNPPPRNRDRTHRYTSRGTRPRPSTARRFW
jgi:hypothetical protein